MPFQLFGAPIENPADSTAYIVRSPDRLVLVGAAFESEPEPPQPASSAAAARAARTGPRNEARARSTAID